jgi:hypothetical protein
MIGFFTHAHLHIDDGSLRLRCASPAEKESNRAAKAI